MTSLVRAHYADVCGEGVGPANAVAVVLVVVAVVVVAGGCCCWWLWWRPSSSFLVLQRTRAETQLSSSMLFCFEEDDVEIPPSLSGRVARVLLDVASELVATTG